MFIAFTAEGKWNTLVTNSAQFIKPFLSMSVTQLVNILQEIAVEPWRQTFGV